MKMQRANHFRNSLKAWLSEQGHTKSGLAKAVEISRSHLDKILAGSCTPSLDLADYIADACGIPLEDMLGSVSLSKSA